MTAIVRSSFLQAQLKIRGVHICIALGFRGAVLAVKAPNGEFSLGIGRVS